MKARKLWAKLIRNTLLQTSGSLQTTLGKWNCHVDARDRQYPTLYDENRQILYQFDGNDYYQLPIHKTSRRHIHATIDAPTRSIRTRGYPVDVMHISTQTVKAQYVTRNTLVRKIRGFDEKVEIHPILVNAFPKLYFLARPTRWPALFSAYKRKSDLFSHEFNSPIVTVLRHTVHQLSPIVTNCHQLSPIVTN
jgi:hypothetical protein